MLVRLFSLTFSYVFVTSHVCLFAFLLFFILFIFWPASESFFFFESCFGIHILFRKCVFSDVIRPPCLHYQMSEYLCVFLQSACLSVSFDLLNDLYHGLIIYIVHLLCSVPCFFNVLWVNVTVSVF